MFFRRRPAEQATARQDQAGEASTGDGAPAQANIIGPGTYGLGRALGKVPQPAP
jgi:hypothetical protein